MVYSGKLWFTMDPGRRGPGTSQTRDLVDMNRLVSVTTVQAVHTTL